MNTIAMNMNTIALDALVRARAHLRIAHANALDAETNLAGGGVSRCGQLVEKVEDCIAHTERLIFCITGDIHAGLQ